MKCFLNGLHIVFLCLSKLSVYNYGLKQKIDRTAIDLTSINDFSFEPIDSERLKISDKDRKLCRDWFDENIRTIEKPAFDFCVGGRSLRKNLKDWVINVEKEIESEKNNSKKTTIKLVHKKSSLVVRVEALIYEDLASCEWTVYIKNEGNVPSPRINSFKAADCILGIGKSSVFFSRGSIPASDDYELLQSKVTKTPIVFNATSGRTESFLPFFNLCGEKFGAVISVGWTGQWYTSLKRKINGIKLQAKQEFFNAELLPGEEIRSPLVSINFYVDPNPLKGFSVFRKTMLECVFPDRIAPSRSYIIANEFSNLNCNELIKKINNTDKTIIDKSDYIWMDAGWYKYRKDWYDGVGNWIPDASRFPDTLKPLADEVRKNGKRFLLWYEPERVRKNTILYNEGIKHDGWIIENGDNFLWNLGNDDACEFLENYISDSLIENGVGVYRQDFNFYPLSYWHKADKTMEGKRFGITENHYVSNLYDYLDTLLERVDRLIVDNCASGGKRIDIEMCRRSVPLWRSDYNCVDSNGLSKKDVLEATQAMTYGLSFWIPYSGTIQQFSSEYAARSGILTHPVAIKPIVKKYSAYDYIRGHMGRNYFPIYYGGVDDNKILAMQFGNEKSGTALVFFRKNTERSFRLRLNGLSSSELYKLTVSDDPSFIFEKSGRELMTDGIELVSREKPYAFLISYSSI